MTEMTVEQWADAYRNAWETSDSEAAARLFTEDATYRSNIYEPPHEGRAGVAAYWTEVTSSQSDIAVRMGIPFIAESKTVIEFWTTMRVEDNPITLAGSLFLDFDESGLCAALREYWNVTEGSAEPPSDWGR